jgi:hypothetical protein
MLTEKLPEVATKYWCECCNYNTDKTSSYTKHLLTAKHHKKHKLTDKSQLVATKIICCDNCNKVYKSRVGLWKHKRTCKGLANTIADEIDTGNDGMSCSFKDNLIIELLKQNQEFKDLMIEQNKQMMELANKAGNNTNCNNNNNNKFNLNVFLNETCKDAITMDDFINSIEVTRDEFIHTGQVGFVEGISTVMAHRFRDMEMHTRPLHCTDLKRETIYIKNADKWEKDDADKTNMRKAVRGVAKKNMKELWRWYNDNKPEVEQIGSDVCEDYFKYHKAALGGYGKEEDLKFEDKIMRNVLKEVQVDKSSLVTL